MFLEQIYTPGIAHFSYVFGDGTHAAVIDPRRDVDIYLDIAAANGCSISHIFETHRNEDLVTGSTALTARCGATIVHGHAHDFQFGEPGRDGDSCSFGDLRLEILETPGHTDESLSFVLYDTATGQEPVGVFSGDCLFINDVGRTDFYPQRKRQTAEALYDSIHKKLLPLGDGVLLYPAHGAGSVCGAGMASRSFSTLGIERQRNPRLQMSREDFIDFKIHEHHYQPPYFRLMEQFNHDGPPVIGGPVIPQARSAEAFLQTMEEGIVVVDLRSPEAFAGANIPSSLALPLPTLVAYGGYLLDASIPLGLVGPAIAETAAIDQAVLQLHRIGYDNVRCFLAGGVHAWEKTGSAYDRIPAIHATELSRLLHSDEDVQLLDVRRIDEYDAGHLPDSHHIFLGELPQHIAELDPQRRTVTFCGSGQRAIIAASILRNAGFERVEDCLGSMQACKNIGCELVEA